MQSARAARVVRALALRRAAPSRLMSGGHGHGAPKSSVSHRCSIYMARAVAPPGRDGVVCARRRR